jgi:branched-chain amino acid transport system permease protein
MGRALSNALPSPKRHRRWRMMPTRGAFSLVELVLLLACLTLVLLPLPHFYKDVVIVTFIWAGVALAWNIAGGFVGLISFGHAAFFATGAYASTILGVHYEVTPWIGIWVGALLAGALGMTLALIGARLRGPFFILATLAAAEVVRIGALNWASLTGGAEGIWITPVPGFANMILPQTSYATLVLGYLAIVYTITKLIEGSRYGLYMFAARDDEDAASAAGVNPLLMRTGAMTVSAFLTAIGGSLFAQYFQYLDPTHVASPELSFQFALLPALGGLGTAIGPVLGAFAIMPVAELLRSYLGAVVQGLHLAIFGGFLIIVMLYFPGGIAGALDRLAAGWRKP